MFTTKLINFDLLSSYNSFNHTVIKRDGYSWGGVADLFMHVAAFIGQSLSLKYILTKLDALPLIPISISIMDIQFRQSISTMLV